MEEVKKCSKCGEVKNINQFHRTNWRHEKGVVSRCKLCVSEYSKEKWAKKKMSPYEKKRAILEQRIWKLNQVSMTDPNIEEVLLKLKEYRRQLECLKQNPKYKIKIFERGSFRARKIIARDKQTGEVVLKFDRLMDAAKARKSSYSDLWNVLNGNKTCEKYNWEYASDPRPALIF